MKILKGTRTFDFHMKSKLKMVDSSDDEIDF